MTGTQWLVRLFSVFILAALAGACSFGTFLSGAGSMRVEVDVYKGPLAKEPAIQLGELVALVHELERSLFLYDEGLLLAQKHDRDHGPKLDRPRTDMAEGSRREFAAAGVSDADQSTVAGREGTGAGIQPPSWQNVFDYNNSRFEKEDWCPGIGDAKDTALSLYFHVPCLVSAQIHYDVHGLRAHMALLIQDLNPDNPTSNNPDVPTSINIAGNGKTWLELANCLTIVSDEKDENKRKGSQCNETNKLDGRDKLNSALQDIAWLSGRLQVKAQYWTQAHVVFNPGDRLTRGRIVTFVNLLSQYSGQLANRADVLLKQLDRRGKGEFDPKSPSKLPLSVYLRDTELSDTLNLFVWNRAASFATFEDMLLHPIEAFSSEETANRVRTAERVFDDQNWHRINEVFASGRGEVNLVLVKDGIGNWSLKTFDSDPAELLAAYTNLAKTALQALAKSTSPDVGVAKSILRAVAAPGKDPAEAAAETDEMIAELRSYYVTDLKRLQDEAKASSMSGEEQKQATEKILRRYRSALFDIRRLSLAGKLPGGGSGSEPEKKPKIEIP